MMKIEFVCKGNTFRSRLAEAYLRSKQLDGVEVSSCGTQADRDADGPITWWAQRIINREGLIRSETEIWREVTAGILGSADLVIFFEHENYEYCRERFNFLGDYQVWEIPDIGMDTNNPDLEIQIRDRTEEIFEMIKYKVDDLIKVIINNEYAELKSSL